VRVSVESFAEVSAEAYCLVNPDYNYAQRYNKEMKERVKISVIFYKLRLMCMIGDKKAEGYARCIGSPFWVCAYLSAVAVKN
jgi:hypothetical protein